MSVTANETISAPISRIWDLITDIENSGKTVTAIKNIKIIEKPKGELLGLKWIETRIMFGKEATETMCITKVNKHESYEINAVNHGCIYTTTVALKQTDGGVLLSMSFESTPQTLVAKIFSPLAFLFRGVIKKAFLSDLRDIKNALEK